MSDNLYQSPETENLLAQDDTEVPEYLNPWKSIWTEPRLTVRYLAAHNPEYMIILLSVISGIYNAINQAATKAKGDEQSLGYTLGTSFVGGIFAGLIGLYLFSWLQKVVGRWLGGVGESEQVRIAYAWSILPGLLGIPFLILQIILFGNDIFTSSMNSVFETTQNQILYWGTSLIETGFGIWAIILHLICLSEVHKFSVWRALATVILSLLLLVSPFILITVLISL